MQKQQKRQTNESEINRGKKSKKQNSGSEECGWGDNKTDKLLATKIKDTNHQYEEWNRRYH